MALTPVQEGQIIDILQYYSETLDLGQAATDILAALGFGDVRVIDLPTASPLNATDVFYVAQLGADVKATIDQFAQFVNTNYLVPAFAALAATLQAQIDAAIAAMQATVNQSINEPKNYFYGQF